MFVAVTIISICFASLFIITAYLYLQNKFLIRNLDAALAERKEYFRLFVEKTDEQNQERKLWTNKSLVRNASDRIFPDELIFRDNPAASLPPAAPAPTSNNSKDDEFLPPHAAARKKWLAEDKKRIEAVSELPEEQQAVITKQLEELKLKPVLKETVQPV